MKAIRKGQQQHQALLGSSNTRDYGGDHIWRKQSDYLGHMDHLGHFGTSEMGQDDPTLALDETPPEDPSTLDSVPVDTPIDIPVDTGMVDTTLVDASVTDTSAPTPFDWNSLFSAVKSAAPAVMTVAQAVASGKIAPLPPGATLAQTQAQMAALAAANATAVKAASTKRTLLLAGIGAAALGGFILYKKGHRS